MDKKSYILSKVYTDETAIEFGGLKGAPCQIQSIVPIEGGQRITFSWQNSEGDTRQGTMDVKDGSNGVSVATLVVTENNHLIVTLSDGTEIDSGEIKSVPKIKEPLTATVEIGTVTSGKTYPAGTNIEQILRDMLIKYLPPSVALVTSPATRLYDVVTESISTLLLKATVEKKTQAITKVSFYAGDTLINEITTGVASGGAFQYQYVPASPINSDITFKATATDGKQENVSTYAIKFVAKSYYGVCDAAVSDPDETVIKSGTGNLKDTRALTYSGITTDWGKVFYAYPKSFGALTYIKDEVNNINYFDSFQRSEKTVDGIAYYCYTLIEPTAATDNQITFK